MAEPENPLANPDGARRYEELMRETKEKAEQALAIAIANSVYGNAGVLDIPHGGTGSSVKIFVDTLTNQFDIDGIKIFHASCGFQQQSDVVDSGDLAGNVRLISCTPQGADIGPQLRFSGRNTDSDLGVFSFATIAGRKSNAISGDKSGYLQFATTQDDMTIVEAMRIDEEQTVGIGTIIPTKGLGNKLWVSGGDILLDNVGGSRSYKLQVTDSPALYGRIQGLSGATTGVEDIFLSANAKFTDIYGCTIDDTTKGTAAIQLLVNTDGSEIGFWIGNVNTCPTKIGNININGLFMDGNVVAGGINNLYGGSGNPNFSAPGFLGGDNIHAGIGNPNGVVSAPVGAIYQNRAPSTSGDIIYIKRDFDYENTGWIPLQLESSGGQICIDAACPPLDSSGTPGQCPVWFDTKNNMLWFWSADADAWLSSQLFTVTQKVPTGEAAGGASIAQTFRGRVNKHYVYFTPTHILANTLGSTGRFNLYLQDLVACIRVANNGHDPDKNYYTFDLVTLKARQGNPRAGAATRQEWPGDRASDDDSEQETFAAIDTDATTSNNIKGFGHTFHPNLPDPLILRALESNSEVVEWKGVVTARTSARKIVYDPTTLQSRQLSGGWSVTTVAEYFFKQQLDRDKGVNGRPLNDGFILEMTSGQAIGIKVMISVNTASTASSPSITTRADVDDSPTKIVQAGDTFLIYGGQYRRVLARMSTKGNIYYPNGPYNNSKTKDIQDFIMTGAYATTFQGNSDPTAPNPLDPTKPGGGIPPSDMQISMNYLMHVADNEPSLDNPLDAVILAGLWDSVNVPGKMAGSVSVSFRLALPSDAC